MNETQVTAEPIQPVSMLDFGRRTQFVRRTYAHLFAAIAAFVAVEMFLFSSGLAERLAVAMFSVSWLWILGGFIVVSWLASRFAYRAQSIWVQYLALGAFVVAEAIIFVPMLYMAQATAPGVIQSAATVTLLAFTGLTATVWLTRKDFSFLGGLLKWGGVLALVTIVGGSLFGFQLGTFFSVAMVGLAGGAILHDTSTIIRTFPEDRFVGAALELFASVALMFWYVLRIFMSRD